MENELLGIGRLATLSGLTVSALRFYDGAQVLPPAVVDPSSGYRYYRPDQVDDARLIARLRRISLPLDDIRAIVADPTVGQQVLSRHLTRLEAGLTDARREISIITRLLDEKEIPMTEIRLPAQDFVRALRDIRYAISADPELPMLNGAFLDAAGDELRLVATDRYRLATSTLVNPDRSELQVLLPTPLVDRVLTAEPTGVLILTVTDAEITVSGSGETMRAARPDAADFPQYRPWLDIGRDQFPVDADHLRRALSDGPTELRHDHGFDYHLSVLSFGPDGPSVAEAGADGQLIGVNREFLLQALEIGDQLTLGLDGPIAPLAIRNPDRIGTFSILMPVRLDQPA